MAFAQIGETDGHDKKRLEPLTKGDHERLQHERLLRIFLGK
jgi:hypothetical protein